MSLEFIDIHYHAAPDLYARRYDAMTAAKHYHENKGAVLFRSHLGSTCASASLANAAGFCALASVNLNHINGGFDWRCVERALAEYQQGDFRVLVDLPTITGRSHKSALKRQFSTAYGQNAMKPETVTGSDGKLKANVIDIIKMARDYPIVLSTGHASHDEVLLLLEACEQYGMDRIILNQPANPMTGLTAQDLEKIVARYPFAYIEQTLLTYILGYQDINDLHLVLRDCENVIYSSDSGQCNQPNIRQWLSMSKALFEQAELSCERKKQLTYTNPMELFSL